MSSDKMQQLISKFFHADVSKDLRLKFYSWFLRKSQAKEKEEILLIIWEETNNEANEYTFADLKTVQDRIWDTPHSIKTYSFVKRVLKIAGIIIFPILGSLIAYWFIQRTEVSDMPDIVQHYVPYGEESTLELPDGSSVFLSSGSLLIYPETYGKKIRDMYLSGYGNFTVAKDTLKTFTVKTNHLEITALGTIFSIEAYPNSDKTITTLEEGKIRVVSEYGDIDEILLPNQQIIYSNEYRTYNKNATDAKLLSSNYGKKGLVFESEKFENIIKALENKYGVIINYENNLYPNSLFTIRFSIDETLEQSLEILSKIVPDMDYRIEKKEVYIRNK